MWQRSIKVQGHLAKKYEKLAECLDVFGEILQTGAPTWVAHKVQGHLAKMWKLENLQISAHWASFVFVVFHNQIFIPACMLFLCCFNLICGVSSIQTSTRDTTPTGVLVFNFSTNYQNESLQGYSIKGKEFQVCLVITQMPVYHCCQLWNIKISRCFQKLEPITQSINQSEVNNMTSLDQSNHFSWVAGHAHLPNIWSWRETNCNRIIVSFFLSFLLSFFLSFFLPSFLSLFLFFGGSPFLFLALNKIIVECFCLVELFLNFPWISFEISFPLIFFGTDVKQFCRRRKISKEKKKKITKNLPDDF